MAGSLKFDFSDRTVLISGASRGMGRRAALSFAAAGANVVACARTAEALATLETEAAGLSGHIIGIAADVSDPADVARLFQSARENFSSPDILLNNTGIAGPTKPVEAITLEEWDQQLSVNLTGAFLMVREAVPAMKMRREGVILNVGSVSGKRPLINRLGYTASKLGMLGMTRTLAAELGPFGIRVNQVSPGAVDGARLSEVLDAAAGVQGADVDALYALHRSFSPLGRIVEESDVVGVLMFLASDLARNLTGQDINVSAGAVMY